MFKIYPDHKESFEGVHRSGWSYVLNVLETGAPQLIGGDVILDTYVDRTFHTMKKKEPYEEPWVGIIHHTFDTTFSMANNEELLKNQVFIRSLNTCRGLYVLSQYQKEKWVNEFESRGIDVEVENLVHPTESPDKDNEFSIEKFKQNEDRSIVHIGAWLRDMYAIYEIPPKLEVGGMGKNGRIKKKILQGPKMEGYYCPRNFTQWMEQKMDQMWGSSRADLSEPTPGYKHTGRSATGIPQIKPKTVYMCRDATRNKYVADLIKHIKETADAVEAMTELENNAYDKLLTENLVMIRLVDASAVNSLLECLVRSTPILINRLPAVEEVLGKEYPFYYDNVYDIPSMLKLEKIKAAHDYLKALNKAKYTDTEFLKSIRNSKIYKKLESMILS